jgi:hypothetical protein
MDEEQLQYLRDLNKLVEAVERRQAQGRRLTWAHYLLMILFGTVLVAAGIATAVYMTSSTPWGAI